MTAIPDTSLYPRVLGAEWANLDERVRRLHSSARAARGSFRVRRGPGWLARTVAALLGLPQDGESIATTLELSREDAPAGPRETWRRSFAGRELVSRQWVAGEGVLGESFGRAELRLRLSVEQRALVFTSSAACLRIGALRIPLGVLAPRVRARATSAANGIDVRVCVALPIAGDVLEYDGHLEAD